MQVQCPDCGKIDNVHDSVKGKKIRCANCTHVFLALPAPTIDFEPDDTFPLEVPELTQPKAKQPTKPKAKSKGSLIFMAIAGCVCLFLVWFLGVVINRSGELERRSGIMRQGKNPDWDKEEHEKSTKRSLYQTRTKE